MKGMTTQLATLAGGCTEGTSQPYCRAVIAPKVAKLRSKYLEKLKV